MTFTDDEVKIIIDLINKEMDGICGDLGYMELEALRKKIICHITGNVFSNIVSLDQGLLQKN